MRSERAWELAETSETLFECVGNAGAKAGRYRRVIDGMEMTRMMERCRRKAESARWYVEGERRLRTRWCRGVSSCLPKVELRVTQRGPFF